MSEYDLRQLNLMMQQITKFENKKLDLFSLQSSLEFLLNTMESVNPSWEYEFLEEITVFESINAGVPVDVQIDIRSIINQAVKNLKKLIQVEIERNSRIESTNLSITLVV